MFPSEGDGDIVEFEEFSKQMRVPFVIYCDFEAFARKLDTCLPDPSRSKHVFVERAIISSAIRG